ncbi:MAG: coenzyme F420-0:L-glutamate ligase [Patescibacteria group bacterium]
MIVKAIKTRKFKPPEDDLWDLLSAVLSLEENSVVAVASKVVSIAEGRCILQEKGGKDKLVIKEADKYLPRSLAPNEWIIHTIKNDLLIASSGIDESNGAGYLILWPKNPQKSAKKIWEFLRKKFKVSNLGVIITDSHCIPMRRGLVGISIAHFGFVPLRDYRGKKDIFGRRLNISLTDIPDSLASAAVLEMGEGNEQQPIAVITDVPYIQFTEKEAQSKKPYSTFVIPEKEDLFYPFLSALSWKKGGSGKTQ